MPEEVQNVLDKALPDLCRELAVDHGLLRLLRAQRVLTPSQIEECEVGRTREQRVDIMVGCLRLSPLSSYQKFRQILSSDEINRDDLVQAYLPELRVDVPIRVTVSVDGQDITQHDEHIAEHLNQAFQLIYGVLLSNPDFRSLVDILRQDDLPRHQREPRYAKLHRMVSETLGTKGLSPASLNALSDFCTNMLVVDVKCHASKWESVRILMACSSFESLRRLLEMFQTGLLLQLLDDVINKEITNETKITVNVYLTDEDYDLAETELIGAETDVYRRRPQLVQQVNTKSRVKGVAQMDDKMFVVCHRSDTIQVFGANNEQLEDIEVKGLEEPWDIVACSETRSLYVADLGLVGCVWRVSTHGQVSKFLPRTLYTAISPRSLSATSSRLLVTTGDALSLYAASGVELKHLSFSRNAMFDLQHAFETSRGTFIFCHLEPQPQVVEVDGDGQVISVYNDQQHLVAPRHFSIDSKGNMFIADISKHHILFLTSDLQHDRILLDTEHNQLVEDPWRLFYVQQTRQLLIGSIGSPVVQVFAVG